jgi:hypothetical protein
MTIGFLVDVIQKPDFWAAPIFESCSWRIMNEIIKERPGNT